MSDVLTTRDVNEIADTEPGALQSAVSLQLNNEKREDNTEVSLPKPQTAQMSYVSVGSDGKVDFEKGDKSFTS